MNYKAFVLGAAVGFLFTLSPACGDTDCESTCAGCCTSDGTCVDPTTASQCGPAGQTCIACSASQTCNAAGLCEGGTTVTDGGTNTDAGTDAGMSTACNTSNCNGCCAGDLCLNGTSASNCGTGGEACGQCMAPAICQAQGAGKGGSCFTPPPANYGAACTNNTDCAPIGSTGICKQTTRPGGATYEGGYCTKICGSTGTMCGTGSTCIQATGLGELDRICAQNCTVGSTTECRQPGYACYDIGGGTGICWISPLPEFDAGMPAPDNLIGSECATDTDCQAMGAFTQGLCFTPVDENMNPSGWPAGYCTANCTDNQNLCGTTGICLGVDQQGNALCFDRCAAGGMGQSDCRADYVCEQFVRNLADGGTEASVDGYCSPDCRAPGVGCGTGQTCNQQGYCE